MQTLLFNNNAYIYSNIYTTIEKENYVNSLSLEENELISDKTILRKKLEKYFPKNDTKKEVNKYIIDTMKKSEEKSLSEKYIFSIYIILNKEKITRNENIIQEMHINLVDWLIKEKNQLEQLILLNNSLNIYININIFIGLLINIINLFEFFSTKTFTKTCLFKNGYNQKLNDIYTFLKCYLIPNFLNINPRYNKISLEFLFKKIENILLKWKNQEECFELSKKICELLANNNKNYLGKKTLRESGSNLTDDELYNSTIESTESRDKDKTIKRVRFAMDKNETIFYDQNEAIASDSSN